MSTTARAHPLIASVFLVAAAACLSLPPIVAAAADPAPSGAPSPSASASSVASPGSIPLDRPFSLMIGETGMTQTGLEVTFVEVAEDSRCPLDVECVWEGDAEVVLLVASASSSPASLGVHTNPRFATSVSYAGHVIELVGLEPHPTTEGLDGPYRTTLSVSATGSVAPPASEAPSEAPSPALIAQSPGA